MGSFKGDIDIDVEVDVDSCFGCLKGRYIYIYKYI